jgi:hypothetical protein
LPAWCAVEYSELCRKILHHRGSRFSATAEELLSLNFTSAVTPKGGCDAHLDFPSLEVSRALEDEASKNHADAPLLRDMLNLAEKVGSLNRFAMTNTLGCVKISKKHDKHSAVALQQRVVAR